MIHKTGYIVRNIRHIEKPEHCSVLVPRSHDDNRTHLAGEYADGTVFVHPISHKVAEILIAMGFGYGN